MGKEYRDGGKKVYLCDRCGDETYYLYVVFGNSSTSVEELCRACFFEDKEEL